MTDDPLRDEGVELRGEERELMQQMEIIAGRLEANRARQEQVKRLILTAAKQRERVPAGSVTSARRTVAKMGVMTKSEVASRLSWPMAKVNELFDLMMCEVPPALERGGRAMGKQLFRYTGPAITHDPAAERQEVTLELVQTWVAQQAPGDRITPGRAAGAVNVPRADATRALRHLASVGALTDISPAADRPTFVREAEDMPDLIPPPPPAKAGAANGRAPRSRIPAIQELLDVADQAGFDITEGSAHYAIESLDGDQLVIKAKFEGNDVYRRHRAWLRRHGANA